MDCHGKYCFHQHPLFFLKSYFSPACLLINIGCLSRVEHLLQEIDLFQDNLCGGLKEGPGYKHYTGTLQNIGLESVFHSILMS